MPEREFSTFTLIVLHKVSLSSWVHTWLLWIMAALRCQHRPCSCMSPGSSFPKLVALRQPWGYTDATKPLKQDLPVNAIKVFLGFKISPARLCHWAAAFKKKMVAADPFQTWRCFDWDWLFKRTICKWFRKGCGSMSRSWSVPSIKLFWLRLVFKRTIFRWSVYCMVIYFMRPNGPHFEVIDPYIIKKNKTECAT